MKKNKTKVIKRIFICALAAIAVSGFAGCNGPSLPAINPDGSVPSSNSSVPSQETPSQKESKPEQQTPQGGSSEDINTSSAKAAKAFILSLAQEKFEDSLSAMHLPETAFVSADDIKWYLPRSNFKAIVDVDFDESKMDVKAVSESYTDSEETASSVKVSVVNKEDGSEIESFKISVYLNDNNDWAVDGSDFYYTDFQFCTTGGKTKVSINGKEVPDSLITDKHYGTRALKKAYKIPYIARKQVTVNLKSDNFDYSEDIMPSQSNELDETEGYIGAKIEDPKEQLKAVKDLFDAVWKDVESGKNENDLLKYLSSDADTSIAKAMKDGIKTAAGNGNVYNVYMSQCLPRDDATIHWISDNKVAVNFKYETTFTYKYGSLSPETQNMRRSSSIILALEDGEYKIAIISDPELFQKMTNMNNEW